MRLRKGKITVTIFQINFFILKPESFVFANFHFNLKVMLRTPLSGFVFRWELHFYVCFQIKQQQKVGFQNFCDLTIRDFPNCLLDDKIFQTY